MRFDQITLVKYQDFEIELRFFDDEGPAPVTFIIRRVTVYDIEKYVKFIVREEDGGFNAEVLKTTRIWRDSYFNLMPLGEFLVKTLGK